MRVETVADGHTLSMTAFGIVLTIVSAISIAIVIALFLWAAREDGREQKRVDERLRGRKP